MSQKTYTERELRVKERVAFVEGAYQQSCGRIDRPTIEYAARQARAIYALPKIERPRVVERQDKDGFVVRFALVDGQLLYCFHATNSPHYVVADSIIEFRHAEYFPRWLKNLLPLALDAYADLKANPTELVEDDA